MRRATTELWILLAIVLGMLLALYLLMYPLGPRPNPLGRQKAQLHSMDAAIELFNNEWDSYPPSDANDPTDKPYCGAMKLIEALMGRDLLGCHAQSVFRSDGLAADAVESLYP